MMLLVVLISFVSVAQAGLFSNAPHHINSEDAHYTIQDIIGKYKNFTDIKREITLYNDHPEYDTSCIKEALNPILSQCLRKSVSELDPKLRSVTAAKLSICEFQVAGIDYPEECQSSYFNSSINYNDCVTSMERKSQWWTSYSGYYRTIGEICHYESLPYEKDAIWDLFMDVTDYYERILEFLNNYVEMTEAFKKESNGSFEELMKFMNEMMSTTKLNKETNDFMWSSIKDQLNKISEISVNVTDMALTQSTTIEENLMSLLKKVDIEYGNSISLLRNKFIDDLDERDALMLKSIEDTRMNLLSLNVLLEDNDKLSSKVNRNLKTGIKTSRSLNETLLAMDSNVHSLNEDVLHVKNMIVDVSDILDNNPFIRAVIYTASQISMTLETIVLFFSMTSLLFFCLSCLNLDFFKFIGISIFAIAGSVFFIYGFIVLTNKIK